MNEKKKRNETSKDEIISAVLLYSKLIAILLYLNPFIPGVLPRKRLFFRCL